MEYFSNFAPIVLCSKLFEIGEKLLKNPVSFLQLTKKAQKAIFWSEIHFFSLTYFDSLANIPNLLGHPVGLKIAWKNIVNDVIREICIFRIDH